MTRPDITDLPPQGEIYARGTPNMWTIASGDEELGLVYLPMGNSPSSTRAAIATNLRINTQLRWSLWT